MSETPKFHPVIEETLVTSGEDIGRVKDVELAQKSAKESDSRRKIWAEESKGNPELREIQIGNGLDIVPGANDDSRVLKQNIGKVAVVKKLDQEIGGIARLGVYGRNERRYDTNGEEISALYLDQRAAAASKEARIVGEEYDVLERMAERSHKERKS